MAKDTYYFQHDYNARNDDKILELRSEFGAEGYGVFWMILETMAENENGGVKATLLGGLSHGYGVAKGRLSEIIERCIEIELFYKQDDILFSKRLLQHKYIRKNLKESGKKGAEVRWANHSQAIATPSPTHSIPNGETMPKERKGKESINGKSITKSTEAIGSEAVVAAARIAWDDKKWREQVCMAHYISEDDLKQWMAQYNGSLCNDFIPEFSERKYMKMFSGWMNTQREKGVKLAVKPSNGKGQLITLPENHGI